VIAKQIEPEPEVGQDNSPEGIQISPNESKDLDKNVSKDLEEAIRLLRGVLRYRTGATTAPLEVAIQAFLSRVGGDNE